MKNKGLIITLIILISTVILSLTGFLIFAIIYPTKFEYQNVELVKKEEYNLENINSFEIDLNASDIEIYSSTTNQIIVEQYANANIDDKSLFSALTNNNSLKITTNELKKIFVLSFGSRKNYYKVYIPEKILEEININTISGEITLNSSFTNLNKFSVKSTSGDIKILSNIETNYFYAKTVSGEVKLSEIISKTIEIKTTSGDIKTDHLNGDLKIESVSGEQKHENVTGVIDLKSTSGDVIINKFRIYGKSNIKTISGEVKVIFTSNSNYEINTKTTSGEIKLANNSSVNGIAPYNTLDIKTTSGDIVIAKD